VPDECHPLDERPVRAHHPVEPPEVVVTPGVRGRERAALVVVGTWAGEALLGWPRQREDQAVEPELGQAGGLPAPRPEAGTPKQPLGLLGAERPLVDANRAGHVSFFGWRAAFP
jgi:hypothetical protein